MGLGSFRGLAVFCKTARILKQGHISQEAFMQSCWVFHWRLIITGDTPLALITSGLIILWERNVAFGRLLMSTLSSEALSVFLQPLTAVIQHFWILNNCWVSSASQCSFWLSCQDKYGSVFTLAQNVGSCTSNQNQNHGFSFLLGPDYCDNLD